jgi:hypothetical protein
MNLRASLLALAAAAAIGAGTAGAVTAAPLATGAPVEHRFFGLLESARGSLLTLRLRSGRVIAVDAAEAFGRERVSEPLFAGKATVVEGTFAPNGVFRADAVKRTSSNRAAWGVDR